MFYLKLRATDFKLDLRAADDAERDAWIVAITRNAHASFAAVAPQAEAPRRRSWRELVSLARDSDEVMDRPSQYPLPR